MLDEKAIQGALHAGRVITLPVENPHGPLGLEHLAAVVAGLPDSPLFSAEEGRVRRPVVLKSATWEALHRLADKAAESACRPVGASEIASAIIERFVASQSQS